MPVIRVLQEEEKEEKNTTKRANEQRNQHYLSSLYFACDLRSNLNNEHGLEVCCDKKRTNTDATQANGNKKCVISDQCKRSISTIFAIRCALATLNNTFPSYELNFCSTKIALTNFLPFQKFRLKSRWNPFN